MSNVKLSIPITSMPPRCLAALMLLPLLLATPGKGQGTLTFTFEGAPPGTEQDVGVYYEAGVAFGSAPGNVLLSGGGVPGEPNNGTGYLEIQDGNLTFSFTNSPTRYFNFLSFDAAEYSSFGPQNLMVVGYKGMAGMTTNSFAVSSFTFQTFNLDSSFVGVYRIHVLNARFSLDNVVLGGVPEPSCCALAALGSLCWLAHRRMCGR
jgi:hypothetical protein